MKQLFYLGFLIVIISCNTNEKNLNNKKIYKPISSWLINNEDSLAKQMEYFLNLPIHKNRDFNTLTSEEWSITDSTILGALTKNINLLDSNIEFSYQYRPKSIKKYALHLTTDKKGSAIKLIDSLFSDIDSLKYFDIIKFNTPGKEFSKFIIQDTKGRQIIIDPFEMGFKLEEHGPYYILLCFSKRYIPKESQEALVYSILGNEIILKQIDSIQYLKVRDFDVSIMTLKALRDYFNIKS
jgi:hypothetical protein